MSSRFTRSSPEAGANVEVRGSLRRKCTVVFFRNFQSNLVIYMDVLLLASGSEEELGIDWDEE